MSQDRKGLETLQVGCKGDVYSPVGVKGKDGPIGCAGYRAAPCDCDDGGRIFEDEENDKYEIVHTWHEGEDRVLCRRCWGVTDDVLHIDYNLRGPNGPSGKRGS